jgi:hypothetical protein
MSKYKLCQVSDAQQWDSFVEESPQGTIFSSSLYLDAVGRKYERFFVCKGDEIKAAFCCIITDDERECELDDLVIYNSLMFRNDPAQKETKARSERFEITEFVIEALDKRFDKIELSLALQFEDLRPFLWHNYHSPNLKDKFKVDLRYTSYIDISELKENKNEEETILFKKLDTIRQRNIREARKKGAYTEIGREIDLFIEFYENLMISQQYPALHKKLEHMSRLVNKLINNNKAIMVLTRNSSGKIIYITIFCFDSKRAYYLFGAGDGQASDRYKGTIGFWDGFKILSKHCHINEIDMEGVNSPQRGWFKLSFGGDLRPYYQVHKGVRI